MEACFEDYARDYVKNSQDRSLHSYTMGMSLVLRRILSLIGYEKGADILEHGYVKSVRYYMRKRGTDMSKYKMNADVTTPARFEDAAKEFVEENEHVDHRIYMHLMINLMESALIAAGYERGVDILEDGYKQALIKQNDYIVGEKV